MKCIRCNRGELELYNGEFEKVVGETTIRENYDGMICPLCHEVYIISYEARRIKESYRRKTDMTLVNSDLPRVIEFDIKKNRFLPVLFVANFLVAAWGIAQTEVLGWPDIGSSLSIRIISIVLASHPVGILVNYIINSRVFHSTITIVYIMTIIFSPVIWIREAFYGFEDREWAIVICGFIQLFFLYFHLKPVFTNSMTLRIK